MSFPSSGVGHLYLHLLNFIGMSLVSLLGAVFGSLVVRELMWYGVGLLLFV